MKRNEVLSSAKKIVCGGRDIQYGSPEDSFEVIAAMWTAYLGGRGLAKDVLTTFDVANLLALMKLARMSKNVHYADVPVDLAGYAACAGECMETEAEDEVPC